MRRSESQEIVEQFTNDIGPRLATSFAEARAAAFVDGCLRRTGMKVSANVFPVTPTPVSAYIVLNLLGLIATLLAPNIPFPSLFLALWVLTINLNSDPLNSLPIIRPRRDSQHVIGNRVGEKPAYRRVVILAPLDSHAGSRLLWSLTGSRRAAQLVRTTALVLTILLALAAFLSPNPIWLSASFAPAFVYIGAIIAEVALASGRVPPDMGAAGAGAVAAMIAAAGRLNALKAVEIWAIGVGASHGGGEPFNIFLRRYPFSPADTIFIAIEGIERGQLVYASRISGFIPKATDPALLRLAAAGDSADPTIDAEPVTYMGTPFAAPLISRGFRVLTIFSRDDHSHQADNNVDLHLIERATRFIVEVVKRIDQGDD